MLRLQNFSRAKKEHPTESSIGSWLVLNSIGSLKQDLNLLHVPPHTAGLNSRDLKADLVVAAFVDGRRRLDKVRLSIAFVGIYYRTRQGRPRSDPITQDGY